MRRRVRITPGWLLLLAALVLVVLFVVASVTPAPYRFGVFSFAGGMVGLTGVAWYRYVKERRRAR